MVMGMSCFLFGCSVKKKNLGEGVGEELLLYFLQTLNDLCHARVVNQICSYKCFSYLSWDIITPDTIIIYGTPSRKSPEYIIRRKDMLILSHTHTLQIHALLAMGW